MLLKVSLVRDVIAPSRAHPTDAGIDFRTPKLDDRFVEDLLGKKGNERINVDNETKSIIIPPGENACIPSGVKIEIPYGFMGMFTNKSGFCSQKDGLVGGGIIDTFYSGEVHLDIHNIGTQNLVIKEGDKIAQLIMVPILSCDITQCDESSLYDWMSQDTIRGTDGFGSTDKK